jgi:hypothetical protein
MNQCSPGAYAQLSNEDLVNRCFELAEHREHHADELAAIDATIHERLRATYGGAPDPSAHGR